MVKDPFKDFRADDAPSEEAFKQLNDLLKQLMRADEEVAEAQAALKKAQEKQRQLDEFDIPAYMDSLGLSQFKNTAGVEIEVESKIRASIGNRKIEAFKWLLDNKHGGMIKRSVVVAFNVKQGKDAEKLLNELRKRKVGVAVKQELKVEPATLTSFVRRELEAGREIPREVFGVYEQRSTKITMPQ